MASQTASSSGPTPAPTGPSKAQIQTVLDSSIWYILSLWPALHVAVRDTWGGPESADKRDWFAGAVSELLTSRPQTDQDDLVIFLLQVMQDEFECNVEDDSEEDIARQILNVRRRVVDESDMTVLKELEERWRNRGQMKVQFQVIDNGPNEEVDEDGIDEDEWEGLDKDSDIDMDAAQDTVPNLVPALKKEKQEPEVDEDGFTKVTKKKR